jgi:hypothetical protein
METSRVKIALATGFVKPSLLKPESDEWGLSWLARTLAPIAEASDTPLHEGNRKMPQTYGYGTFLCSKGTIQLPSRPC